MPDRVVYIVGFYNVKLLTQLPYLKLLDILEIG